METSFHQPGSDGANWQNLYNIFMGNHQGRIDPFRDLNIHHQLIESLRAVGLNWDASKLETVAPGSLPPKFRTPAEDIREIKYQRQQYHDFLEELFAHLTKQGHFPI